MEVLAFREGLALANDLVLHRVRLVSVSIRGSREGEEGIRGELLQDRGRDWRTEE